MGKHEPMTAKAIGIRIKAKGLQKTKFYCQICEKQCRDANGFKCHIMSESHQRQALVVNENPDLIIDANSKEFTDTFMYILRTRYKFTKVLANTVYQEQIKDKEHIHLNGTRWTQLTDFAHWLGEQGLVEVDSSERGVMITYVDRDPETLRRQQLELKRAQQAKEAQIKNQKEIERQMEMTKKLYREFEKERPPAEPVPIIKFAITNPTEDRLTTSSGQHSDDVEQPSNSCDKESETNEGSSVIERPLFKVQAISLKSATTSTSYKPPKRKVLRRPEGKKKVKSS